MDALASAAVDGQLGRRRSSAVKLERRAAATGQQLRAFDGEEAAELTLPDLGDQGLDSVARVDPDRDERKVFGQAQQALGLEPVLTPEPFGSAQQDARLERLRS